MDETIVKKLRGGMTGSVVASAIFAILGAIGIFVLQGIAKSGALTSDDTNWLTIAALAAWDFVRLGGFGMFACGLIFTIFELFGGAHGKAYAFVMLGGSVFGFIGVFMLSLKTLFNKAMSLALSISLGASGSSSSLSFINVPCVFVIVSAVIVFVALGIRASNANRVYVNNYPGYPQQGYPQQVYPQQVYPQGYPQQGYPQQEATMQSIGIDPTNSNQTNNTNI